MRLLILFLFVPSLAQPATLNVRVSTGPLGAGTFYLDFQLNDSDGVANNSGTLDQFYWLGIVPGAVTLDGTASGDLTGGFQIHDGDPAPSFFNGILIAFDNQPGGRVDLRARLAGGFSGGGFPDLFSLAILDSSFFPVRSQGTGALLEVGFAGPIPQVTVYAADPAFGGVQPEIGVPEPASWMLLAAGLVFGAGALRRHTPST